MKGKGDLYRAEVGRVGDGVRPPKARDTGRGMRSRVEVYRRPPDGAKRRRGALAEFRQRRKGCECDGVGSRREETPRGKGAKRLAGPKLRIDRGGMGGGNVIDYDEKFDWTEDWDDYYNNRGVTGFTPERHGIFHYCVFAHLNEDKDTSTGGQGSCFPDYWTYPNMFVIYDAANHGSGGKSDSFMHELGHNIFGRIDSSHWYGSTGYDRTHCKHSSCTMYPSGAKTNYCSECWNELVTEGIWKG